MEYDKYRVARRLKSLRVDKGWSQDDLARESDVSKAMIANIETARSGMGLDTAFKITGALDWIGYTILDSFMRYGRHPRKAGRHG